MAERVTVDLTTGVGTVSFPHLFMETASKNDAGEAVYEVQLIIPKAQRDDARAILAGIKKVGEAKWGANWKKVRSPLRDGDKEAEDLTEDGKTKGEKYPERLGCYFINARSKKPVGVFDRMRNPILDPDKVYGGCKAKINISLYPYSSNGNHGIGVGLNGVQKITDGEAFGNARPNVESMFDLLDDEDDLGVEDSVDSADLDDDLEEAPAPAKKVAAKKAAVKAPAKEVAAKKPVIEEDEDDLFGDLDDLDD